MKNQFFYTRKQMDKPVEKGGESTFTEYTDSFSLDYVISSIGLPNGERVVILDDFREFTEEVPVHSNRGHVTGKRNVRNSAQSEIHLNKEDSEKFLELNK